MARVQTDREINPVLLRPAASPVDTFVDPGPNKLEGLARSLAGLSGSLGAVLGKRDKKKEEEDELRGEASFYEDNAEGDAASVQQDLVPAHESKAFQRGRKGALGRVAGVDMQQSFDAAFDAWDGKNVDDPEGFQKFVGAWIKDNIKTTDPDVLRTLMPAVRELYNGGYAKYQDYRSKATYTESQTAHGAVISQEIDAATKDGLSTPDGTDYDKVAEAIEISRAAFISSGGREADADKMVIDTVAAKAVQLRDPGLLDILKRKVPGKDYTFAETPYGLAVKENSKDAIEVISRRNAAEETVRLNAEQKAKGDEMRVKILDILSDDPMAVLPDDLLAEAKKYDDTIIAKVAEWRGSLNRGTTDRKALLHVYDEIMDGGGLKAVRKAQEQGVFGSAGDLKEAVAFAKSYEENKSGAEDLLKDNYAEQFMKQFDIMTKGKNNLGDPIAGTSTEGLEAQWDFKRAIVEFAIRNPDATYLEKQEFISKAGKLILERIVPADPDDPIGGEAGEYKRAEDMPYENPFDDAVPGKEAESPTLEPRDDPDIEEDVQDFLGGMEPSQRATFEQQAREKGLSPEDLAKQLLGPAQAPAEGAAPATPDPDEEAKAEPISYTPGKGLAALVTSNKRGRAPDVENLRPVVASGVSKLQASFGKELPIVSGYRSPKRNAKAGGAKKSQHMHGNAVDIDVSSMPKEEQIRLIEMASAQGFTGIGVYGGSIHLDYGGRRAWGPTHGSESVPPWAKGAIQAHLANTSVVSPEVGTPMTQEDAMAYLEEAINTNYEVDTAFEGSAKLSDPSAARLANLVKQREANGNYNAIAGNPNSKRDLSAYTVNQIMAMQVGAKARTGKTPAVGAYQLMLPTFRTVKGILGLTGKEKFTPELQDRIFEALIMRRGWNEFKAGKLSHRQFALRLSQEWAALPNPKTGKSYYEGVGNNKSRTKTREVYAALGLAT